MRKTCAPNCSYYPYHAGPHEFEGPVAETEWQRRMNEAESFERRNTPPEELAKDGAMLPLTIQDVLNHKNRRISDG